MKSNTNYEMEVLWKQKNVTIEESKVGEEMQLRVVKYKNIFKWDIFDIIKSKKSMFRIKLNEISLGPQNFHYKPAKLYVTFLLLPRTHFEM